MIIRNYNKKDFSTCGKIINKIWNFDIRFEPQILSDLFKKIYIKVSLSTSNFAIIIEGNNDVRGFLFGNCGKKNLFINEYSGIIGKIRILIELFFVRGVTLKKKFYYLKIIRMHEKNRSEVESNRENEVNLFAVDPTTQGKGYGKILMNNFIEFCKEQNVNCITLDTDKECNYRFYDHYGFQIVGDFFSPLQKEYSGKSGDSYVYELKIQNKE